MELIEEILPTIYTFQKDDREKTEEVASAPKQRSVPNEFKGNNEPGAKRRHCWKG